MYALTTLTSTGCKIQFLRHQVFVLMVSGLNGMAIKGYFSSSVLSSTQELVIILVKFLQHLLGAANVVH